MGYWENYYKPATIEEALELLAKHQGNARIIGGGTDLLLEIQQGHRPPVEALVDPTGIAGLDRIVEEDGFIVIGAGVTHTMIVEDERIRTRGTCLVEGCGVIGGPQVRNVATLAGNIAHALPAGDGTISLLALDGEVEIAGPDGIRWVPMASTFLGPGNSTVDPTSMLITRMRFKPTGAGEGSAFRRIMRPQGVALPVLSMAARLRVEDGLMANARVTLGPADSVPFLAEKTGDGLKGKPLEDAAFHDAVSVALEEVHLRDSKHRSSAAYREGMIRHQLSKVIAKAGERAGSETPVPEGVGE